MKFKDIETPYNFTKYGKFMYKLTMKWTSFLIKHRFLYYFLACTWGIIATIFGWVATIILCLFTFRLPKKYNWVYYIQIGKFWGGLEAGLMFIRDKESDDSINEHEWGHSFQNCLFGPFAIILIFIPSAIRYWIMAIKEKMGKEVKEYDSIWFEASASNCGEYANNYLYNKRLEKESK